jgi:hypothetical protein
VPVIVGVGIIVGGAAVTLELVCVAENYREQVAKVEQLAREFESRFSAAMSRTTVAVEDAAKAVRPAVGASTVKVKLVASEAWAYANRTSVAASKKLGL